jgi:hypothetical protein
MTTADQLRFWLAELKRLEDVFAREKRAAANGRTRGSQTPDDLVQIWKKRYRANDLRGEIADAHRNIHTYALATLAMAKELTA